MKLISVIMSVYDETVSDISRAVTSILNQTYENIELIVILDKPDNIDAFNYLKSINDKRIIFLPNKENIGLGFSLNNAINAASGDYIARMDADDVSHPDRLKNELNYLTNNALDLVFCEVELVGKHGEKHRRKGLQHANFKEHFFKYDPFVHATMLIKTDLMNKHLYRISHAPEDYDLYFRLYGDGAKFGLLNGVYYTYYFQSKLDYRPLKDRASRCYKGARLFNQIIFKYYKHLVGCKGLNVAILKNLLWMLLSLNTTIYKYSSSIFRKLTRAD